MEGMAKDLLEGRRRTMGGAKRLWVREEGRGALEAMVEIGG